MVDLVIRPSGGAGNKIILKDQAGGTVLTTTDSGGVYVESKGTSTCTGTTITVDLSTGNFFEVDFEALSGDVGTFTISNTNANAGMITTFILKVIQGSTTTTRNITWASLTAIKWPGGTTPTVTAGNDQIDLFVFSTYDNGSTWYGTIVGQDFS